MAMGPSLASEAIFAQVAWRLRGRGRGVTTGGVMNPSRMVDLRLARAARAALALIAISLAAGGCGKKAAKPEGDKANADAGPAATPPLPVPELGVDQVRRFNFPYGDGAAAYARALTAYKAKPRDWAGVRSNAEAALAKDAYHLEAHRLVAAAMAQDGDYTGAAPHVLAAMAGDWQKYGASLAADADLAGLMGSPTGAKLQTAAATIKETFLRKAGAGLLLLGRRSTFKLPDKPGVQPASSRGELYAYDRESKRFLRLSQTDHSVAGFLRSPSGKELVLIGFDKLELPGGTAAKPDKPGDKGGAVTRPTAEPMPPEEGAEPMPPEESVDGSLPPPAARRAQIKIARAYALLLDAATFEVLGKRTMLPKGREVAVGYALGERLVAVTVSSGSWNAPDAVEPLWLAIDASTAKTAKTEPAALELFVAISAEAGDTSAPLSGLRTLAEPGSEAGSQPGPATGAVITGLATEAGTAIELPDATAVARRSLSIAPDKAHLAFATAPDPCNPDVAPSLYVADAGTGALKHVLTGKSRFISRWLDATTLAYEDPDGAVRLWDVTSGRESLRLADKGGLALAFLATSAAPVCVAAVR
jgi:hypothetical protein